MNSQLFIASSVVQNTAVESLTSGQLGLYGIDSVTNQTISVSPTSKVDLFYAALGKTSGGAWLGRELKQPRNRNFELRKFPYRAAVKPIKIASIDCIGSSVYDEFELKIVGRSLYEGFGGIESYFRTYSVMGKYANSLALYTALKAQIDADGEAKIIDSVTVSSAGITIIGKVGQVLTVSLIMTRDQEDTCLPCVSCEATVVSSNDGDTGSGTYDQLLALQKEWAIWAGRGYMSDRQFKLPMEDFPINSATTWDMYLIKWTNENQPNESHGQVFNVFQQVMVAVPSGTNMSYFTQTVEGLTGKTFLVTANL